MAHGPEVTAAINRLAFQGDVLFDRFQMAVPAGQVVALLGRSGVGKTTLLRVIAGAEAGFDGDVRIAGVPAASAPIPGFVFQDARLLPWCDAVGNIRAVAPRIDDARCLALIDAVGLTGFARAFPHQMSGGMQRRLGLARALAVNSGLFLLDEPFASLDRDTASEVTDQVRRVFATSRPTVVLVSHDAADAARLAHRAVVLAGRPARIVADVDLPGDPAERSLAEIAEITATLVSAQARDI